MEGRTKYARVHQKFEGLLLLLFGSVEEITETPWET